MRVYLSPRRLSLFQECKRCFFDEVFLKLKRPRGAYPTLPSAVDEMMKRYCDDMRAKAEMPLALKAVAEGMELLNDQKAIERMRFWKEGLSTTYEVQREYEGKVVTHALYVQGSIDELIFHPSTDTFTILDFKTRREAPDEGYSKKYYQTSMDTYAFLLDEMGLECNGRALLWYMWPKDANETDVNQVMVSFGSMVQELEVDGKNAVKLLQEIADIVPRDTMLKKNIDAKRPNVNPDCEYCTYKRKD